MPFYIDKIVDIVRLAMYLCLFTIINLSFRWLITNEKYISIDMKSISNMPVDNNKHMRTTQNKKTFSSKENITFWIEVSTFLVLLFGFAYTAGKWTADRVNKEEIILLNQKHNKELTDLKIDFNNQIMEQKAINRELQNKLDDRNKKGGTNE